MRANDLRVGLIGPLPPPSGGMANQTRQLKNLLESEGIQVNLVQVNAPYRPTWVERLRGIRSIFRLVPYLFKLWSTASAVDIFHVMANSGWSWYLFARPAIWVARLKSIPVVVNYRGGEAETFLTKSHKRVVPDLGKASAIIVPTGFLENVFSKWNVSTEVVPNIIDLNRFKKDDVSARDTGFHIVVTRNLEKIYDISTAIRAFKEISHKIPEARLSVAGSGPELEALMLLVSELEIDDQVEFTGRLEGDGIVKLYQSADIMINPSTVDNMPNSVLEAMASQVSVISTNVGGVPYIIDDNNTGLLVSKGDYKAMADMIVKLHDDQELRQSVVDNAYEYVQQYKWDNVRNVLLSVYKRVIVTR